MPYTTDADLPRISDDTMHASLADARPYTLVVLNDGPNIATPEAQQVIWEHGRRNFALRAAGLLSIVCPVNDGSDMAGVAVYAAPPDEVERICAADPAVQAGVLRYQVHPTFSFPGDSLPAA
jgi:hypothetical protein